MSEHVTAGASLPNFEFTESMTMVRDMARSFAEKEIRPHVMKYDESMEFPTEIVKKLGELGFLGVIFPEKYGGAGFSYLEYVAVIEEIAKADASTAWCLAQCGTCAMAAKTTSSSMPFSRSRATMRSRVRCEVKPTPRELAALRLLAFTLPASRA